MKHKDLEVYVGLTEGGCEDVGHLNLHNYTLLKDERLFELEAAEKERDNLRLCVNEWLDKTEWVQRGINEGTISPKYLGLHRADIIASLLGAAEKERDDVARQLVQSEQGKRKVSEECDALRAKSDTRKALINLLRTKINTLRTKIECMERQEPVAWCATDETGTVVEALGMNQSRRFDTALYLAPGAKGEEN